MKLVYTHVNHILVANVKNCLTELGIDAVLRNEYSAGGIGELAPTEAWPELWVDDNDYEKGQALVSELMNVEVGDPWICDGCKETNEANFQLCWSCQLEKKSH